MSGKCKTGGLPSLDCSTWTLASAGETRDCLGPGEARGCLGVLGPIGGLAPGEAACSLGPLGPGEARGCLGPVGLGLCMGGLIWILAG